MTADPHLGQPVREAGAALDGARSLVTILIHGRNAAPANILELVPALDRPQVSYRAPAAAGRTWYPQSFLAPRDQNEPFLSSALASIGRLVDDLVAHDVPSSRIVVAGFSQGACLATEFVYRYTGRLGGLVALTGGLIGPPGTTWDRRQPFEGMPAFFGSSDIDAHVPLMRVEESVAAFRTIGATVTSRIYASMGHVVNDDEIAHAAALIDAVGVGR
jgi:predicted esterase